MILMFTRVGREEHGSFIFKFYIIILLLKKTLANGDSEMDTDVKFEMHTATSKDFYIHFVLEFLFYWSWC